MKRLTRTLRVLPVLALALLTGCGIISTMGTLEEFQNAV